MSLLDQRLALVEAIQSWSLLPPFQSGLWGGIPAGRWIDDRRIHSAAVPPRGSRSCGSGERPASNQAVWAGICRRARSASWKVLIVRVSPNRDRPGAATAITRYEW